MSLLALAFVVVAQVNNPAGDAPPLLDAPVEETPKAKPIEPVGPVEPVDPIEPLAPEGGPGAPPVLQPKKKSAPPTTPAPDASTAADDIAFAAGAGGIATGLCSACACGWVPFFGVPVVGVATAVGAAGGAMYGAKGLDGWGTPILISTSIAGAGAVIGAGLGTGLMAIAVFSVPPGAGGQSAPLIYGAIAGAVLLSGLGATGGALGGAWAIGAFAPTEDDAAPNPQSPRRPPPPAKPGRDDGKAVARY
jgi:hypothetical protein